MAVLANPTFQLQPSAQQVALSTNYISNTQFNYLNQYLPDTFEKEFERYGNRTVSSFLRMVGAEMPSNSDLIKWAEQGRLHIKYTACTLGGAAGGATAETFTVPAAQIDPARQPSGSVAPLGAAGQIGFRKGQTVMVSDDTAASALNNKGIITAVTADSFTVSFYEAAGLAAYAGTVSVFIYGSEFRKGVTGMEGGLISSDFIFENSPIILKDKYQVSGSDMAQIGWIEITTEDGASGYMWYLKSEHETRLRFDDYLETSMVEAVPAEAGSGAATQVAYADAGNKGSEGVFYVVGNRGNVWGAGNPVDLAGFDSIISRLDKQGSIEENVIFVNRNFSFDIDDMLAAQNSYGAGGSSYGLFDNDEEMALNLGFTGFRRGYDFYKSEWKYLNDPTMRGGLVGGAINGLLVPAGSTTVYDQILGKNAKRPFLHVRYRASETEDRRYKSWITGSAGGAQNQELDAMTVNYLSERCVCTLGANNFFLFQA
tara:strand:+ start:7028 stop:8482 length:1455 start_codon:yes stop_codon:yes gene_type:complete